MAYDPFDTARVRLRHIVRNFVPGQVVWVDHELIRRALGDTRNAKLNGVLLMPSVILAPEVKV